MSWDAYRRRKSVVAAVLTAADADATVSLESALADQPDAADVYPDPNLALLDIQLRWSAALAARLDQLAGSGADTPEIGVVSAWVDTAAALPGARRLLDAGRARPQMATAVAKENAMLARAAGVPAMSPSLTDRGQAIADRARERAVLPEISSRPAPSGSILDRLRNALAA